MRELKFRAWHLDNGMLYFDFDTFEKDYHDQYGNIMQFTGLKDKNAVDIYEGDIVNDEMKGFSLRRSIVEWDSVNPCFVLKRIDFKYSHIDYEYDFVKCDLMTIEVIGNIHENKDLV